MKQEKKGKAMCENKAEGQQAGCCGGAVKTGLAQWTSHESEYRELLIQMSCIAEKNGYVLNSDNARVEKVLGRMTENKLSAGRNFCPCKQSQPLDTSKDVICPCPDWKKEIDADGHCFCKLFFKKQADVKVKLGLKI